MAPCYVISALFCSRLLQMPLSASRLTGVFLKQQQRGAPLVYPVPRPGGSTFLVVKTIAMAKLKKEDPIENFWARVNGTVPQVLHRLGDSTATVSIVFRGGVVVEDGGGATRGTIGEQIWQFMAQAYCRELPEIIMGISEINLELSSSRFALQQRLFDITTAAEAAHRASEWATATSFAGGGVVQITAGSAAGELATDTGGSVTITGAIKVGVGDGDTGAGGDVQITNGKSTSTIENQSTGGAVLIKSGTSAQSSSRSVTVTTASAGTEGVSGALHRSTGATAEGDTGAVVVATASAGTLVASDATGSSGAISILTGDGAPMEEADGVDGRAGRIAIEVGESKQLAGGDVEITAGKGTQATDAADAGTGGSVVLTSGGSAETSSGAVLISTAAVGQTGVSGGILLSTGTTESGGWSAVTVKTGAAARAGRWKGVPPGRQQRRGGGLNRADGGLVDGFCCSCTANPFCTALVLVSA
eukprot:g3318.t1